MMNIGVVKKKRLQGRDKSRWYRPVDELQN